MIGNLEKLIPNELLGKSGSVFYSGKAAFEAESKLYIIGLNPGGNIETQAAETIKWHTDFVLNKKPHNWSEYRDESWGNAEKGKCGMQPRVLHLLDKLNLNPGNVPASNLIFQRSSREKDIKKDINYLAELCWPVHQYVIDNLRPKLILCFGKTAGNWVRKKLNANIIIGEFVEQNNRKWRTLIYQNKIGVKVVIATHPSIADWTSPSTDPSDLIVKEFT